MNDKGYNKSSLKNCIDNGFSSGAISADQDLIFQNIYYKK